MVNTSSMPMTVDGTRLDTLAWNIETLDGRLHMPGVRGANPIVPGRHGSIHVPNKTYDDGEIILKMWVIGSDVDGLIPGGSSKLQEFRKNVDTLNLLFSRRNALLDVRWTWPQGVRQALCEVLSAYDLSARASNPEAKFNVALNIPDVFWRDVSTSDYASATGLTSGTTLTMAVYDGATAPMEDHIIVVRGPITNPRLTDVQSGQWVQYNGTLATGTDWQVDSGSWTSKTGSALLFGAGGTNVIASTTNGGGGPRLLPLSARVGGPQVTLTGSSTGAGTQVQARGRRKFFT